MSGYVRIRLETEDKKYVVTGSIPDCEVLPDVVLWSLRAFRRHLGLVYREVSAVPVTFAEYLPGEICEIDLGGPNE